VLGPSRGVSLEFYVDRTTDYGGVLECMYGTCPRTRAESGTLVSTHALEQTKSTYQGSRPRGSSEAARGLVSSSRAERYRGMPLRQNDTLMRVGGVGRKSRFPKTTHFHVCFFRVPGVP